MTALLSCTLILVSCGKERNNIYDPETKDYSADISSVVIDENAITVYSEVGNQLWNKNFDSSIDNTVIYDIDDVSGKDMFVTFKDSGEDTGKVFAFNGKGDSILSILPPKKNIFNDTTTKYFTRSFFLDTVYGASENIVLIWAEVHFFASKLCIYDLNAEPLGELWNPGHISEVKVSDLDTDGENDLLVRGFNNDFQYTFQLSKNPYFISRIDPL